MAVIREVWSVMAVRRVVSDGCKKKGMVSDDSNKGGLVSTVGFTLFVFFLCFFLSFFQWHVCVNGLSAE